MKDELCRRTQVEDESSKNTYGPFGSFTTVKTLQHLNRRVIRAVRQTHPRFKAYLKSHSFSSLDVLARAAGDIQAVMFVELAYQPPPLPEYHEPSCTWHDRSNPTASPITLPRALDPFSHYNTSAPSAFTSTAQEHGTPTLDTSTQTHPVATATQYSAGGTSRSSLVCFQCGSWVHYRSQCPSRPRTGR
ncbi:hypothetical protein MRX96_000222 [Rhipicephalus microplus]